MRYGKGGRRSYVGLGEDLRVSRATIPSWSTALAVSQYLLPVPTDIDYCQSVLQAGALAAPPLEVIAGDLTDMPVIPPHLVMITEHG
jgi:hypothetical protein